MNDTRDEAGATLKFGLVTEVDPATCRVKVRLPDMDGMVTDWLPVNQRKTQDDKTFDLPDIGEQATVLLDGRGEDGVVLGSTYSSVDKPPDNMTGDMTHRQYKDGAIFHYDREQHKATVILPEGASIDVTVPGGVANIDMGGGTATIKATGGITLEGPVTIKGNLSVQGNIHATGTILDDGGNSNHHSH